MPHTSSSAPPALVQGVKPTISRYLVVSDSIGDRGTADDSYVAGFIPMSWILRMTANVHNHRFSNSYVWGDNFGAMVASAFLSKHFTSNHKNINDVTDIADAIIHKDQKIMDEIDHAYNLDDDRVINYKDQPFFHSYCIGGLTAADYRKEHVWTKPVKEISRHLLSTLDDMTKKVIDDDKNMNVDARAKLETDVIISTGANDLITVNDFPTDAIADKAVTAIIENIKKLYAHGYRHITLFTLPDLSLAPRYNKPGVTDEKRKEISRVCHNFNAKMITLANQLKQNTCPEISVDIFDINRTLRAVMKDPELYGFDSDKIHTPFVNSEAYRQYKSGPLSAERYPFWDDVHPASGLVWHVVKNLFAQKSRKFNIIPPELTVVKTPTAMYQNFMELYKRRLEADRNSFFGCFQTTELLPELKEYRKKMIFTDETSVWHLTKIFNHALNGGGERTKDVLRELGWLDSKGNINVNYEALLEVKNKLENSAPDIHSKAKRELEQPAADTRLHRTQSLPSLRRS